MAKEEEKKHTLVYDLASIPNGRTLEEIMGVWVRDKIVIYDSDNGSKPVIVNLEDTEIVMIDVSNAKKEVLVQIEKLLKNDNKKRKSSCC